MYHLYNLQSQCEALVVLHERLETAGPLTRLRMREVLHVVFDITEDVMLDLTFKAFDRDNDNYVCMRHLNTLRYPISNRYAWVKAKKYFHWMKDYCIGKRWWIYQRSVNYAERNNRWAQRMVLLHVRESVFDSYNIFMQYVKLLSNLHWCWGM